MRHLLRYLKIKLHARSLHFFRNTLSIHFLFIDCIVRAFRAETKLGTDNTIPNNFKSKNNGFAFIYCRLNKVCCLK